MLGFGTVGTGTFRMLADNRDAITKKIGLPVEVVKVAIRDAGKVRYTDPSLFTTDAASIVEDPAIDVVLELIGGVEPAHAYVESALNAGKSVVTANKELIAKHGSALVQLAQRKGSDLHYEAAVGGGIPLVQPLKHQLAGNDVLRMMGILNGTTNYILTKMARDGAEFADALSDAQALGYAEADPTNDIDGFDVAYKISILASIAFGKQAPVDGVYREGIRRITKADMRYADLLGYAIKLLGIVEPVGEDRVRIRVHPTLVPKGHQLSSVSDVYNALWLQGDFVGNLMFSGRGAGSDPTASAVIGDLIDVGRNLRIRGPGSAIPYGLGLQTVSIDDLRTEYYVRLVVLDRPRVLGILATIFGDHAVSLAAMEMRVLEDREGRGEIVFLTHLCREADFRDALDRIAEHEVVDQVCTAIRVVG